MTVRDLLVKAFRTAHILGAGEPMDADDADDAFDILNAIIEEVNIDKTLAFYQTTVSFPLVSNQLSYSIGPASSAPNVIAPRPVEVMSGFSRRDNVDLPIFIGAKEDYDSIQQKDTGISGWIQLAYYEATFPKGILYVYQKPLDSLTSIFLAVMAEIAAFATLDDAVSMPPGYRYWLQYKLSQRLCPEYGMPFSDSKKDILLGAEEAVKRNNIKPMPVANTGLSALGQAVGGGYNVYSDTTRR